MTYVSVSFAVVTVIRCYREYCETPPGARPYIVPSDLDLFIAGGISNCPDWQPDFIRMLSDVDGVAANPRRSGEFDVSYGREQIAWEHTALSRSHCFSFWFPEETLCPITLFELGKELVRDDITVFVGTSTGYTRRFDVVEQLRLEDESVVVRESLDALADDVRAHLRGRA